MRALPRSLAPRKAARAAAGAGGGSLVGAGRSLSRGVMVMARSARLGVELAPVIDHVRTVAVDLEPGDRLVEGRAVEQAALRAMRRVDVEQAVLHAEDLLQALDVAARIGSRPSSTRRSRGSAEKRWRRPTRPSGCSSEPARIALVSVSGAPSNCAR